MAGDGILERQQVLVEVPFDEQAIMSRMGNLHRTGEEEMRRVVIALRLVVHADVEQRAGPIGHELVRGEVMLHHFLPWRRPRLLQLRNSIQ